MSMVRISSNMASAKCTQFSTKTVPFKEFFSNSLSPVALLNIEIDKLLSARKTLVGRYKFSIVMLKSYGAEIGAIGKLNTLKKGVHPLLKKDCECLEMTLKDPLEFRNELACIVTNQKRLIDEIDDTIKELRKKAQQRS